MGLINLRLYSQIHKLMTDLRFTNIFLTILISFSIIITANVFFLHFKKLENFKDMVWQDTMLYPGHCPNKGWSIPNWAPITKNESMTRQVTGGWTSIEGRSSNQTLIKEYPIFDGVKSYIKKLTSPITKYVFKM